MRSCRASKLEGCIARLDHQRHIGRVLDLEVQAGVPPSGLSEELKDGPQPPGL